MNDLFCGLFSRRPEKVICGDYYYGTDADGDQFFEEDRDFWLGGCFRDNRQYKQHESPVHAEIFNEVRRLFSDVSAPFYDDEPGESWKEKFIKCGFEIESCDKSYYHKWDKSDNEFGKQAERTGIDIGDITTLYVL